MDADYQEQASGFGSPLQSLDNKAPDRWYGTPGTAQKQQACSPLEFNATPQRFSSWVQSTSPYVARKTPQTASMASVTGAGQENSPAREAGMDGSGTSTARFHRWLSATGSTSWTPKRSLGDLTPQLAAPANTPAVTPASALPRSRPLFDLREDDASSSDDEAAEEQSTPQPARRSGLPHPPAPATTPASVEMRSPVVFGSPCSMECTPEAAGRRPPQAALAAGSPAAGLVTPMSMMSMGARTPGSMLARTPGAPPPTPAEQVIGLMMEPGLPELRQPPPTPEQQLIDLMVQPDSQMGGADNRQMPRRWSVAQQGSTGGAWRAGAAESPCDSSDDELGDAELAQLLQHEASQQLPLTPISDIIHHMMLTPGGSSGMRLTPARHDESVDARPRELFGDQ